MRNEDTSRRVVVTGLGVVSALGASAESLWAACRDGRSGLKATSADSPLPITTIASADEFEGKIQDFGALDDAQKKAIRKGCKLMAREIQMGVASAQLALQDGGVGKAYPSKRIGVSFASDFVITTPQELVDGVLACRVAPDAIRFTDWPINGLTKMTPLWQLKYLTNMSASHITIYNELYGPAYDVTNREASFATGLAEAVEAIKRGAADAMVVGATGSKIHPYRFVDSLKYGELSPDIVRANGATEPAVCRPFDKRRNGVIPGEGAGSIVIEAEETAKARGAKIYAEVLGGASRGVLRHERDLGGKGCDLGLSVDSAREAYALTLRALVAKLGITAADIGHINAAARGDVVLDAAEALALRDVFGDAIDSIPTTTLSGHIGNPGAGCGAIQTIASILALENDALFPVMNYEEADPDCRLNLVREYGVKPGDSFLKLCGNSFGQTSAVMLRRYAE